MLKTSAIDHKNESAIAPCWGLSVPDVAIVLWKSPSGEFLSHVVSDIHENSDFQESSFFKGLVACIINFLNYIFKSLMLLSPPDFLDDAGKSQAYKNDVSSHEANRNDKQVSYKYDVGG